MFWLILLVPFLVNDIVCPDPLLDRDRPVAPTQVRVVMEANDPAQDRTLPLIGASEINRLAVTVRVLGVGKGKFPIGVGKRFRLAVHSIALSFGGDNVGEQFDLYLDDTARLIERIEPAPESVVRIRCVIRGPVEETGPALRLTWNGKQRVRIHVDAEQHGAPEFKAGSDMVIGVSPEWTVRPGAHCCLVLLRRVEGAKRAFRLMHTF